MAVLFISNSGTCTFFNSLLRNTRTLLFVLLYMTSIILDSIMLSISTVGPTIDSPAAEGDNSTKSSALYRIWCGVNRLGDSGVKVV